MATTLIAILSSKINRDAEYLETILEIYTFAKEICICTYPLSLMSSLSIWLIISTAPTWSPMRISSDLIGGISSHQRNLVPIPNVSVASGFHNDWTPISAPSSTVAELRSQCLWLSLIHFHTHQQGRQSHEVHLSRPDGSDYEVYQGPDRHRRDQMR